jgi:hypothetical protein
MQTDLHFDQHTFGGRALGRYHQPASVQTGISNEDYKTGMHTERHVVSFRQKRWVPAFSANDASLRLVIAQRLFNYTGLGYCRPRVPDELAGDWKKLSALADAHFERIVRRNLDCPDDSKIVWIAKHSASVRRAGGYAAMIAAVAYRCWRLGQDSVTVAQSLGITPGAVRQQLTRLLAIARKLGLECGSPHWSTKPPKSPKPYKPPRPKSVPLTHAERSARASARNLARYARPGEIARMSAYVRAACARPEVWKAKSKASKAAWARRKRGAL